MDKLEFCAQGDIFPISAKEYLHTLGFSVTLVKTVKHGGLFLNGEQVTVRATVCSGDVLTVYLPDEVSEGIVPMDIPLTAASYSRLREWAETAK